MDDNLVEEMLPLAESIAADESNARSRNNSAGVSVNHSPMENAVDMLVDVRLRNRPPTGVDSADRNSRRLFNRQSSSASENNSVKRKSTWTLKSMEKPPTIDFYRKASDAAGGLLSTRPSMMALFHGKTVSLDIGDAKWKNNEHRNSRRRSWASTQFDKIKGTSSVMKERVKFGWVEGVFVRCLLNILGVMLYLRISWVAGQAGLLLGSLIVLLASTVTTITTLSMCAICTNGEVKGGGAYFLISRSLGPEFGGAIGLIFSVANSVGAAMYVVGFAETVRDIMKANDWIIIDNDTMDVRIIGLVTCTVLMSIVFIGTSFESRMQLGLLVILTASLVNYFVGTFFPVSEEQLHRGITGYSLTTIATNLLPAWRGQTFFSVFAVYFPAATGIMAGANISGDLADPQKAIPKGTLLAIATTTAIYLGAVWMTGTTCVRDATGLSAPILANDSWTWTDPDCVWNTTCQYGLMNYFQVMQVESAWGPLITAGIFAATLSSALASLVSAPKVFQAVCKDRLFPYISYFAKGYGKDDEPRRAYGLGFGVAMLMILIGDLNAIAPIISNFFLASYTLINYACFHASFANSPGFRPGFKYFNMWVSLGGAVLCLSVMFIISWSTALITFLFFAMLLKFISHRHPKVNWGSSTQAQYYKSALNGMLKLATIEEHVKNYRPQVLVLSGNPVARTTLVDFVRNITKGSSLMICGHVVPNIPNDQALSYMRNVDEQMNEWLRRRRVKAFYVSTVNQSLRAGVRTLLQVAGLGKLRPNIVFMGFKADWTTCGPEGINDINEYFGVILDSFDSNMGMAILSNAGGGLDLSEMMKRHKVGDTKRLKLPDVNEPEITSANVKWNEEIINESTSSNPQTSLLGSTSNKDVSDAAANEYTSSFMESVVEDGAENEKASVAPANSFYVVVDDVTPKVSNEMDLQSVTDEPTRRSQRPTAVQRDVFASINRFNRSKAKSTAATIDVWWLYDDGGLTLLIPHLLALPKSYLAGAKLRVFTIASSRMAIEQEQRSMLALLNKFRINVSHVVVLPEITGKPSSTTLEKWESLIAPFRVDDANLDNEGLIKETELSALRGRTNRQLRCRELLLEHSTNANLIVVTLPVPRKGQISSCLYMAWLDVLTRDLPPTLLIRGNQTSVLTFYS